jgi:hypothetical protein
MFNIKDLVAIMGNCIHDKDIFNIEDYEPNGWDVI